MPLAGLAFLTPYAALFAVAAVVPLVAFAELLRRERRVRAVLAMPEPRRRSRLTTGAALSIVPVLIALAATQPVLELGRKRVQREDAEVYVVFDTSRSMLAADSAGDDYRLKRAEKLALELRPKLAEVPFGIASFTDRVLPHLFPSIDQRSFGSTVDRSIGIEAPPPSNFYELRATHLSALRSIATRNFFSPAAEYRLAIVLTDGESDAPPDRIGGTIRQRGVQTIFVHVWDEDERIFGTGDLPEPDYKPEPSSVANLNRLAASTRGRVFQEGEVDEIAETARTMLGAEGKRVARFPEQVALAPWVTLAAFLPLGLVLRRRNV